MTEADESLTSKQLWILEPQEIEALYARPQFTPDEQSLINPFLRSVRSAVQTVLSWFADDPARGGARRLQWFV